MSLLFVGAAPSRTSDPTRPLSGRSGKRLEALLGRPLRDEEKTNLLPEWPGRRGFPNGEKAKGDDLARHRLRMRFSARVIERVIENRAIVLLGEEVARAFLFDYVVFSGALCSNNNFVVVFPHPSGINRWWNDEEHVDLARRVLRHLEAEL